MYHKLCPFELSLVALRSSSSLSSSEAMESAHALAVVCRAKQIVREEGIQVEDGVLGYMCRCSDIDGSWWDLLQVSPPVGQQGKDKGGALVLASCKSLEKRNNVA